MVHPSITEQMVFALSGDDKASFDNYWVGDNAELLTAMRATVQTGEPKVVYFYGPSGAGKSHLLFASLRFAAQQGVDCSYLSLSDPRVSLAMLEAVDVHHAVCIDDAQLWAGDEQRERALFTLFEQIKFAGGQLIVSAKQPPDLSGFVINDLVSRLSSGLIYALHRLDEEQQFNALKMRAECRGLAISDESVRYLLSRATRDTSELFSVLDKIDRASLVEKRRITIPFLQTLLKKQEI